MLSKETVDHPDHYKGCSANGREILWNSEFPVEYLDFECIEVIESLGLDFSVGNAIKYLWRVGNKKTWWNRTHSLEDLKKSKWYLERYLTTRYEIGYHDAPWADSLHTSLVQYLVRYR